MGSTRQAESRSAGPPATTWARDFPGAPEQAGKARRFLAAVLDSSPAADDAILCLSELASNACLHSRSGRPGGRFTVRAALNARDLRVEVRDDGGPWVWPARRARPGVTDRRVAGPGLGPGR